MSEMACVTLASSRPSSRPLVNPKRPPEVGPCSHVLRLAEENRVSTGEVLRLLGPDDVGFSLLVGDPPTLSSALRRLSARCRYCPRCLSRGDSWHWGWETPCIDACPRCGCWLVDECAACHRPVTWSRSRLMECPCGAPLTQGLGREAPEALVALARSMVSLGGASKGQSPIAGLDPRRAAAVVWFLGCLATGGCSNRRAGPVELPPMRESWSVTSAAAEIVVDWPRAFCRVLDQCREQCPEGDRGSLLRVFPKLYSTLYRHPRQSHFEPVRDAFEGYVLERWPGQIAKRHTRLEDRAAGEPAWIRLRQASRLTGYPVSALKELVQAGSLESKAWTTLRGRNFLLLRRAGVDALLGEKGIAVDLSEAAVRLGLSESRLADVLPRVCPDALAPIRRGGRWSIPATWVEGWELFISRLPHEARGSRFMSVADSLRYFLPDSDALSLMLAAIWNRTLPAAGRTLRAQGLPAIVIERGAFRQWLDQHKENADSLSIKAVAARLDVKQEVAYFLARRGLLAATSVRLGRRIERRVSEKSLEEFLEVYVFAQVFAQERATSARAIRRYFDECGVAPVCGPGIDRCRQLLYRRSEAAAAISLPGLSFRVAPSKFDSVATSG